MFGISTTWNSFRHDDARSMIEEIKKIGVDCIELDFKLNEEIVSGIKELVDGKFVKVLSLHNFCPMPEVPGKKKPSPDYYSLASIDKIERKKAVEETRRTIDTACRLKAQVVITHGGRLKVKDKTRKLAKVIDEGGDAVSMLARMQKKRDEELKKGYLDALLKSIGELSDYAKKCGIKIGLENRFYFRELPSIEEFEVIFENFNEDSNIAYWHDVGHAQVFENLKISRHKEYLNKFSKRLIGVHLHDIKGTIDDHRAPLTGDFDFAILKPYLHKDVLKVLEPHYPATAEEVKKGLEYLRQLYK